MTQSKYSDLQSAECELVSLASVFVFFELRTEFGIPNVKREDKPGGAKADRVWTRSFMAMASILFRIPKVAVCE